MDRLDDSAGRPMETLPIHFDVPGHQLPLATFIVTAMRAAEVLQAFNRELFDGSLRYEVVVLPPEEGTFLTRLGIAVALVGGAVWGFVESDIGKALIEGLTTHEPAYWAHEVGEQLRRDYVESEVDPTVTDSGLHEFECKYSATILVEVTKSFLQAKPADLRTVGITPGRYGDAFEARNAFYDVCAHTPNLRAIGFSEAPHFPVPQTSFAEFRVPVPPKDEEDENPWLTGMQDLKVTSPNWDRDDRQRQWKGKDNRGRERFFRIEDEHFWALVKAERLNPHIIDTLKVQWAFHGTAENPRGCRILKVLEYNGEVLSAPFDDNALASILGPYQEVANDQPDLFEPDQH